MREGGGGLRWGRGRGNVSSSTIPTPNQLSLSVFPCPINVTHGAYQCNTRQVDVKRL